MSFPPELPALPEFLSKNTAIKILESPKDLQEIQPTNPQFMLVVAPWCGYSQLQLPQYEVACDQEDENACYVINGHSEGGQKIIKELGFEVEGYPTLFIKDHEETVKITGMQNVPKMREAIQKSKSALSKHRVGSRPSVFPL